MTDIKKAARALASKRKTHHMPFKDPAKAKEASRKGVLARQKKAHEKAVEELQ